MDNIKTNLGILQRVAFFLLRLISFLQISILSQFIWYVISRPCLYLAWVFFGEKKENIRYIIFYNQKRPHRFFGKALKIILIICGKINGLSHRYSAYEMLLRWNPAIPLIALKHKKTTWSVRWLGKETQAGWYNLEDDRYLSVLEKDGHFMIIKKATGNKTPGMVCIECVWLTGENRGKVFTISDHFWKESDQPSPEIIYFPPKPVAIIFDCIVSLGAATLLIGSVIHGWSLLESSEIYKNYWQPILQSIPPFIEFIKNKLLIMVTL